MSPRAGRTLASMAAFVPVGTLVVSCAWVAGISGYTRVDCEGDCATPLPGADAGEGGIDASVPDAPVEAGPRPFTCGGVVCASTELCCGDHDGGALRCASSCGSQDVLVQCDDDSQCSAIHARCCGDYDRVDDAFVTLRCQTSCELPLCPDGGSCPEGTACKPLFPLLAPICTP